MSEMIERVAAALLKKHQEPMGKVGTVGWRFYMELAEVAIAAMREPTEAMIERVGRATCEARDMNPQERGGVDDRGLLPRDRPAWRAYGEEAIEDYQSMIEAALDDGPRETEEAARIG